MTRKERIYHYVKKSNGSFTQKDIESGMGLTAKEIADVLGFQRSNVSKDLNQLVREGKLSKTDGRPVRFIPINSGPRQPLTTYVPSYKEEHAAYNPAWTGPHVQEDIFQSMIGSDGSMKNAVEQAKAAILYPPKGLNTLITGPTGSGKSFFAHAMFHFAQACGLVAKEKELVVFNCADYANNPQLLMSHLFGYVQGAFTGAAASKEGLIQQADGGILFLDEVHRLPPEGQEMVFYFMDTGMYSRLGETGKNSQAQVRIVCATTEDPKSSLLDTFMRRIPIHIQLPSFKERPVGERLDLVKLLTGMEANRIQKKITLSENVVKGLIASVGYGNVGQLKSSIQLVCARGFMNQLNQNEIYLTAKELPEPIQDQLASVSSGKADSLEPPVFVEAQITIHPNEPFYRMEMDSYELPYNLYDIIGDKAALLEAEGLDQEAINQFISTDINVHLKSFYRNHGFSLNTESRLADVVSKEVVQFAHLAAAEVEAALGSSFKQNFIYAVSLHISSLLNKIHAGQIRKLNNRIREMAVTYPKEFAVAEMVKDRMMEYFEVSVPENEVYYLTVLLVSLKREEPFGKIGVVIGAHGNSTATSMARVAEELLDASGIIAVDMPLDMSPSVVYERIKQGVVEANEGNGVLLLVDMGSLTTFESKLQKETGITVRTIDMVSTAMVLEAARKASMVDEDIELLHESLSKFSGYTNTLASSKIARSLSAKPPIMVAVCASGEGTAQKLKEIIEEPLSSNKNVPLQVKTCSVMEMDAKIAEWEKEYTIVAATGVADPKLPVPFIPLEKFIEGEPQMLLERIDSVTASNLPNNVLDNRKKAKDLVYAFLDEQYTFLNPRKVMEPLWEFAEGCAALKKEKEDDFAFYINLSLHMAGAIERLLHEDVSSSGEGEEEWKEEPLMVSLKPLVRQLEKTLSIRLPEQEYRYILYFINKEKGVLEDIDTLLAE